MAASTEPRQLAEQLATLSERPPPRLAVVDGDGGAELLDRVLETLFDKWPGLPVLVTSRTAAPEFLEHLARLGVRGYLPKASAFDELGEGAQTVAAGGVRLDQWVLDRILLDYAELSRHARPASAGLDALSEQQRRVLAFIARGSSNQEIAEGLGVTVATVKFHTSAILRKLGVASRTEAAVLAVREGLTGMEGGGAGAANAPAPVLRETPAELEEQRKLMRIALHEARLLAQQGEVEAARDYLEASLDNVQRYARCGSEWARVLLPEWRAGMARFEAAAAQECEDEETAGR